MPMQQDIVREVIRLLERRGIVSGIRISTAAAIHGEAMLVAGSNMTITQAGQSLTLAAAGVTAADAAPADIAGTAAVGVATDYAREDHVHRGVVSIAKSGSAAIYGAATVSAGSGIAVTQTGQDLQIALTGGGSGGAVTQIAESVLASAAAVVTFTGISGTYRHLEMWIDTRSSHAGNSTTIAFEFNNDTANNYGQQQIQNYATSVAGAESLTRANVQIGLIPGNNAPANDSGGIVAMVIDYARTTFFKHVHARSIARAATGSSNTVQEIRAGTWRSTAAITEIDVVNYEGNFNIGSVFTLYGYA